MLARGSFSIKNVFWGAIHTTTKMDLLTISKELASMSSTRGVGVGVGVGLSEPCKTPQQSRYCYRALQLRAWLYHTNSIDASGWHLISTVREDELHEGKVEGAIFMNK